MIYSRSQIPAGFSIVEMLVAISLLLLVIIGPMTITTRTAKSTTYATEQVTAFFLAQEGLELAQKLRDDLLLQHFAGALGGGDPWTLFTTGPAYSNCYNAAGCGLEWNKTAPSTIDAIVNCNPANACLLRRDTSSPNGRSTFTYDAAYTPTIYTRKIYFTVSAGSPDSVLIKSVVTWRTGSLVASQRVEVETYVYDIY